ncbi:MAG: methyltransferase domain-containing protein [Candidatus Eremiobacteraeota bacterium]|nr:methyltransferase domain-containing protein [Candidatus Eremiobacteraeota bacterium]
MKRATGRELMDDPAESIAELEENLRDIERANRWLGGIAPVRSAVFSLGAASVLDVGCGSADIPLALVDAARERGTDLHITCLDSSAQMLEIAQERADKASAVRFVQGNGMALPFPDRAFDVVTCNLALHHFDPPAAIKLLEELRRVALLTPIVCDLRRSQIGYAGALVLSRLFTRNRFTRHDAPLSARRAYTPAEARELALQAGWRNPTVHNKPFYRMLMLDA